MSVSAGWYPDPDPQVAPGSLRWWDGAAWTDQTQSPHPIPSAPVSLEKARSDDAASVGSGSVGYRSPDPAVVASRGSAGSTGAAYRQLKRTPDGWALASPWKRLGAAVIDGIVVSLVLLVVIVIIFFPVLVLLQVTMESGSNDDVRALGSLGLPLAVLLVNAVGVAFSIWYYVVRLRQVGATWGKRALGLRVRTFHTDGQLTWAQAWTRALLFPQILGAITCGLGAIVNLLWLLWDPHRQCLHDKAAGTVVIDTRIARAGPEDYQVREATARPAARGWFCDGPVELVSQGLRY